ncbi:DNA-directed DNA polymerase [Synchytrium endobioticum]|uniref:DNA-directed DNA polymerase n=1 Tax=Synchytrium endobioticum TaxID=286115 RepID=A0A507BPV9_9FUNG|nr:DNA-directed DNA polymerase [Synchytrium endobioticum]
MISRDILKPFFCLSFLLIITTSNFVLTIDAIFIGYEPSPFETVKGWKFWEIKRRKPYYSRNVAFLEKDNKTTNITEDEVYATEPQNGALTTAGDDTSTTDIRTDQGHSNRDQTSVAEYNYYNLFEPEREQIEKIDTHQNAPPPQPIPTPLHARNQRQILQPTIATTRTRRAIHPPRHDSAEGYKATVSEVKIPKSYKQAMKSVEATEWVNAMSEEVAALIANKTWELVDSPKNKHVLPGKWIYVTKHDEVGSILKYKARWVVQGNHLINRIDYDETFAPTSHLPTLYQTTSSNAS